MSLEKTVLNLVEVMLSKKLKRFLKSQIYKRSQCMNLKFYTRNATLPHKRWKMLSAMLSILMWLAKLLKDTLKITKGHGKGS